MAEFTIFAHAGDLNGDGQTNFGDLTPFVKALIDPAGYAAMFPGLDRVARGDVNGDGQLNFADLTPFVNLLVGGSASGAARSIGVPMDPFELVTREDDEDDDFTTWLEDATLGQSARAVDDAFHAAFAVFARTTGKDF
jgi:hypothetical protein